MVGLFVENYVVEKVHRKKFSRMEVILTTIEGSKACHGEGGVAIMR